MKNKWGWTDKSEVTQQSVEGKPLTKDQLWERLAPLLAKMVEKDQQLPAGAGLKVLEGGKSK
jgi:hypothetical protein